MNADELDAVYTALCRAMTAVGEARASLLLARFALLAIVEIADADRLQQLIAAAAQDLTDPTAGSGS
jgi:hypothetical protein